MKKAPPARDGAGVSAARWGGGGARRRGESGQPSVGMVNSASVRMPVGQRIVVVLMRV